MLGVRGSWQGSCFTIGGSTVPKESVLNCKQVGRQRLLRSGSKCKGGGFHDGHAARKRHGEAAYGTRHVRHFAGIRSVSHSTSC